MGWRCSPTSPTSSRRIATWLFCTARCNCWNRWRPAGGACRLTSSSARWPRISASGPFASCFRAPAPTAPWACGPSRARAAWSWSRTPPPPNTTACRAAPWPPGTEVLVGLHDLAPPAILAQAARLSFVTRLFNLVVTNVPGPQAPLHVLGREIREVYPVALLPRDHALSVAVLSYNGRLSFGLLADFDTLPELEQVGEWLSQEIDALLGL